MPPRFFLFARLLLTATLGGFVVAAQAAAPTMQARLIPEQPAPGMAFRVEVSGEWPASCAPLVGDSWVDGFDIVLQLKPAKSACKHEPASPGLLVSAEPGDSQLIADREGVYRLRVIGGSPESTRAFALVRIGASGDEIRPETGFWWPERGGEFANSGPGLGAQVELQDATVALTVSGYDNDGHASWWFGASQLESNLGRMQLSMLEGGSGPLARYSAPKGARVDGELQIEWVSAARAVFWFVAADDDGVVEVNPVSMVRFAFAMRAGDSWRGRWVIIGQDEHGLASSTLVDFTDYRPDGDGFSLRGADNLRLRCQTLEGQPDSPPILCQLETHGTAGATVSELDDIGLQHLRGLDARGRPLELVRLAR